MSRSPPISTPPAICSQNPLHGRMGEFSRLTKCGTFGLRLPLSKAFLVTVTLLSSEDSKSIFFLSEVTTASPAISEDGLSKALYQAEYMPPIAISLGLSLGVSLEKIWDLGRIQHLRGGGFLVPESTKTYVAIDAKSFYASVELVDRHYDPLTTNLVVADPSRTEKTICLAVSPSLKAYGISGRARLFEVVQRVKEVNAERLRNAIRLGVAVKDPDTGKLRLSSPSFDADALRADPSLELSYIVAPPRMKLYEKISTKIFSVYSRYISPDDIHVYSIDEVFLDVTPYLNTYKLTAHELAMKMIREVLYTTGITATAGIGTNMYLAKVAMDIVAKHVPPDAQGVRIAELNEMSYREKLWCHKPLTDFWRVGIGTSARLESIGCRTMGDVARKSIQDEEILYDTFGINAELLIDHAWGWEPATIASVKAYQPENKSISSGQVLKEPYDWEKGRLITKEMTELLVLDLVRKGVVTKQMTLTVGYDRTSIKYAYQGKNLQDSTFTVTKTGKKYMGTVGLDMYGRPCPKHAHGTGNLDRFSSSTAAIMKAVLEVYDSKVDPDLYIRRVNIAACGIIDENDIPEEIPEQLNLFVDYEALERERSERLAAEDKERRLQRTTLLIQEKYGKNAMLKGMNFLEGGTTRERNEQIGGHRAGNDEGILHSISPKSLSADEDGNDEEEVGQ